MPDVKNTTPATSAPKKQPASRYGNIKSVDQLRHPRSDAYSAKQVLMNKQQICCGGADLHCYRLLYSKSWYHAVNRLETRSQGLIQKSKPVCKLGEWNEETKILNRFRFDNWNGLPCLFYSTTWQNSEENMPESPIREVAR